MALKRKLPSAGDRVGPKGRNKSPEKAKALNRRSEFASPEMAEIVARVSRWAGGADQALAWYRAQPISAFGDRTPESLVKSGQAEALRDYLDSIALGGFA